MVVCVAKSAQIWYHSLRSLMSTARDVAINPRNTVTRCNGDKSLGCLLDRSFDRNCRTPWTLWWSCVRRTCRTTSASALIGTCAAATGTPSSPRSATLALRSLQPALLLDRRLENRGTVTHPPPSFSTSPLKIRVEAILRSNSRSEARGTTESNGLPSVSSVNHRAVHHVLESATVKAIETTILSENFKSYHWRESNATLSSSSRPPSHQSSPSSLAQMFEKCSSKPILGTKLLDRRLENRGTVTIMPPLWLWNRSLDFVTGRLIIPSAISRNQWVFARRTAVMYSKNQFYPSPPPVLFARIDVCNCLHYSLGKATTH